MASPWEVGKTAPSPHLRVASWVGAQPPCPALPAQVLLSWRLGAIPRGVPGARSAGAKGETGELELIDTVSHFSGALFWTFRRLFLQPPEPSHSPAPGR